VRTAAVFCAIAAMALMSSAGEASAQWAAHSSIAARSMPLDGIRGLSDVALPPRADPGAPSAAAIAGQVALGTLATPVGYVGGGLATRWVASRLGAGDDAARRAAYIGAYSGAALTTAVTVEYLGRTGRVAGSFPVTLGGAVAG